MRDTLSVVCVLSAWLLPCGTLQAQESIPLPELRTCAEFEPALGTLICYPTGLPLDTLGVELAEDDTLFVLVDDAANQAEADAALSALGVDMSHVEFILAPTSGYWTRDFGAPQIFHAGGAHSYVDPIFYDYSFQAGGGGPIYVIGPGAFVDDDVTPAAVAAHLGVGHIPFPAHLVGGNIDFDGLDRAFCTWILLDENRYWGIGYDLFRKRMNDYLGVSELLVVPNYEVFGIQHIDCALKVLDEETLLITRTPPTHPSYGFHEALAQEAATQLTAYGRPYVIHRVEVPVFDGGPAGELANYANSLILNGKVLVPLFGLRDADARALEAYRQAMPGYEVLGFPYVSGTWPDGSWASFDALHCRTHQVFDPEMILIKHPRIRGASASAPQIEVMALIRSYGSSPLVSSGTDVQWRVAGTGAWNTATFQRGQHRYEVLASIPPQPAGTTIEYFIQATTADQHRERRPPLAPSGYYSFEVN